MGKGLEKSVTSTRKNFYRERYTMPNSKKKRIRNTIENKHITYKIGMNSICVATIIYLWLAAPELDVSTKILFSLMSFLGSLHIEKQED